MAGEIWGLTPEIFVFLKFPGLSPNFASPYGLSIRCGEFRDRHENFKKTKILGVSPRIPQHLNQIKQAQARQVVALQKFSSPHLLLNHDELRRRHR